MIVIPSNNLLRYYSKWMFILYMKCIPDRRISATDKLRQESNEYFSFSTLFVSHRHFILDLQQNIRRFVQGTTTQTPPAEREVLSELRGVARTLILLPLCTSLGDKSSWSAAQVEKKMSLLFPRLPWACFPRRSHFTSSGIGCGQAV